MTEQHSPWARPPAGSDESGGGRAYPSNAPVIEAPRQGPAAPDVAPPRTGRAGTGDQRPRTGTGDQRPRTGRVGPDDPRPRTGRAGTVTRLGATPVDVPAAAPETPDPARRQKRTLLWFGGSALAVVGIG